MKPQEIVEALIGSHGPVSARRLIEASVHLPRRSSRWVAAFRDETGRQVWRSTGQRDRESALAIAKQWEVKAKRKRAALPNVPAKPTIRVRRRSGEEAVGMLTQREVAMILQISERTVREIERRAFEKLRRHPALQEFWREWTTGDVEEAVWGSPTPWALKPTEIAAVYALAETPQERQLIRKLLRLTQQATHGG